MYTGLLKNSLPDHREMSVIRRERAQLSFLLRLYIIEAMSVVFLSLGLERCLFNDVLAGAGGQYEPVGAAVPSSWMSMWRYQRYQRYHVVN